MVPTFFAAADSREKYDWICRPVRYSSPVNITVPSVFLADFMAFEACFPSILLPSFWPLSKRDFRYAFCFSLNRLNFFLTRIAHPSARLLRLDLSFPHSTVVGC